MTTLLIFGHRCILNDNFLESISFVFVEGGTSEREGVKAMMTRFVRQLFLVGNVYL